MIYKTLTSLIFICLITTVSSTLVTFYIDHQIEQPLDYVQINAIVKSKSQSLDEAIRQAALIIAKIQTTVDNYCKQYTPFQNHKTQCNNLVQSTPFSIKPQYQLFKKKQIFGGFYVAHEIFIRVKQSQNFGNLVDNILKIGVNKINSLEWKPIEQIDPEEDAVEQGLKQAHQICKKLNSQLSHIVNVQQITDFGQEEEEEQEGQQRDQDDEEEDQEKPLDISDDITYYKFVVECKKIK